MAGWVYPVITGTSDLFMNINKNRKARTCQSHLKIVNVSVLVTVVLYDLLESLEAGTNTKACLEVLDVPSPGGGSCDGVIVGEDITT